jgi:hypothetical protein
MAGKPDEAAGAEHEDLLGHGTSGHCRADRAAQDKVKAILTAARRGDGRSAWCLVRLAEGNDLLDAPEAGESLHQRTWIRARP